jgi:hypothetical protein
MSPLDSELRRLAAELAAIQKRAKALGIFTNERELLHCLGCGLKEDMAADGVLFTYHEADFGQDTGLRFKQVNKHTFRCPACGQNVKEPISDRGAGGASSA